MSANKRGAGLEEPATAYAASPAAEAPVTVTLVPEHGKWAEQAVAEGRFESVDEAITYMLDHILPVAPVDEDQDWMIPLIQEALNDPQQGIPGEDTQAWLRAKAAELRRR